jgi:type VI secretion system protein ImpK
MTARAYLLSFLALAVNRQPSTVNFSNSMSTPPDDPFQPRDATVLRPRPGAGKRGANKESAPLAQPRPAGYQAQPISEVAAHQLGIGLNPLVQAASSLLLLAGRIRGTLQGPDVATLQRQVLEDIRRFEERARASGVANEIVLAARYALCAALDESVLTTPWGAHSEWAQTTLLVTLHREAWGGEKFFDMLERISQDPVRHIDLMELQYLCMAMGFAGKFHALDRGQRQLEEVQHDLYRRIRDYRGVVPAELSLRWEGLQDRRNPLIRYVPWWVVGAAALAILTVTFIFFYVRLAQHAAPVQAQLAKIGLGDFSTAVAVPDSGPSLKELLAPEIARSALTVEEEGGRTLITLIAPKLFTSGSATVNPEYYGTLQDVAHALDQVPGRILVVGHTDDQRLTSLRYKDNFELSRERAVSVVEKLKLAIANPARMQWTGVGSTEPRYRPESLSENRARNRRVEIVHVREGK